MFNNRKKKSIFYFRFATTDSQEEYSPKYATKEGRNTRNTNIQYNERNYTNIRYSRKSQQQQQNLKTSMNNVRNSSIYRKDRKDMPSEMSTNLKKTLVDLGIFP